MSKKKWECALVEETVPYERTIIAEDAESAAEEYLVSLFQSCEVDTEEAVVMVNRGEECKFFRVAIVMYGSAQELDAKESKQMNRIVDEREL